MVSATWCVLEFVQHDPRILVQQHNRPREGCLNRQDLYCQRLRLMSVCWMSNMVPPDWSLVPGVGAVSRSCSAMK